MVDIPLQFADIGNALAQGVQARALWQRADREDAAEKRRQAVQVDIPAATAGDNAALGRVAAGDPHTAVALTQMLTHVAANKRAQIKDAADYTARAANAVLQADPSERATVYQQMLGEGAKLGYNLSGLPTTYTPAVDSLLRSHRAQAVPIAEWFKQQEGVPTPMGGGAPTGGGASAGGAAPNRDQFIATMMPHALEISKATGLDPRLVIAQSALETGWGAAAPGNNFFGIKSHGAPGGQTLGTTEVGPNGAYQTQDSFRTYGGAGESAQDYTNFLKTNGRYGPLLSAQGLDAQIAELGKSGYATDPRYADKVRQIAYSLPTPGAAAPGVPGPVASPQSPLVASVPQANTAQMPGPPAGVLPTGGPPPAQMPQPPGMVPQGSGGDGSGTPVQPPEVQSLTRGMKLPPGARMMGIKGVPVVKDGNVLIVHPDGTQDWMPLPSKRDPLQPPAGYQAAPGGGLMPIPGGPADPTIQRRQNVPPGYRLAPDGNALEFIPGGPADPSIAKRSAPMNNEQARDAGFADRMLNSNQLLDVLAQQGTNTAERLSEKVPLVGGYMQGAEYQRFKQAREDFINAQLRRESGAAISKDEYDKADRQYFPQPGDKPEVIKQKALNRKIAVEAMVRGAGPSYKQSESVGSGDPAAPPSAPAPSPAEKARDSFQGKGSLKPPSKDGSPPISDGATATNPQTGQKIIFKGGQWSPVQ